MSKKSMAKRLMPKKKIVLDDLHASIAISMLKPSIQKQILEQKEAVASNQLNLFP